MIQRSRLLNMLSILIGALLSYALSQIDMSIYYKIELLINYKWLLICSLMIILTLIYFLFSKSKAQSKLKPKSKKSYDLKLTHKRKKILKNITEQEQIVIDEYIFKQETVLKRNADISFIRSLIIKGILIDIDHGQPLINKHRMQIADWARIYYEKKYQQNNTIHQNNFMF